MNLLVNILGGDILKFVESIMKNKKIVDCSEEEIFFELERRKKEKLLSQIENQKNIDEANEAEAQLKKNELEKKFEIALAEADEATYDLEIKFTKLKNQAEKISEKLGLPIGIGKHIYRPKSYYDKWLAPLDKEEYVKNHFDEFEVLIKNRLYFGGDYFHNDCSGWWWPSETC